MDSERKEGTEETVDIPFDSMRQSFDLGCYFVVGPQDCAGRDVAQVVSAALAGGATFIQLRVKPGDAGDIVAMARRIADVIAAHGLAQRVAFVIDDRVDAAWQARREGIKVDGVHIGQSDLDPVAARRLLGPAAIVGLSAKTLEQVKAANALPEGTIDYLGAGPVHLTATKPDCRLPGDSGDGTLDAAAIDALCAASRYPVTVGGGVKAADIPMLAGTQADGWFVVSAISAADDPAQATRELVEAWRSRRGEGTHRHAANAMRETLPAVLTVAGTDSSGGAGVPADMKTIMALGCFAECAVTAVTAQNTTGVQAVEEISPDVIAAQIESVFADIPPAAVKIGMVSSAAAIEAIAHELARVGATNIVVDPVMVATSGAKLIADDAVATLTERLFPLARVITPNIPETQALCAVIGRPLQIAGEDGMAEAAQRLAATFGCAVLVKGGHGTRDANDVLVTPKGAVRWFHGRRIDNPNTHGTGCTLSSAIASYLARGFELDKAIELAKRYLTGALAAGLDLGEGSGPMDHAWGWR